MSTVFSIRGSILAISRSKVLQKGFQRGFSTKKSPNQNVKKVLLGAAAVSSLAAGYGVYEINKKQSLAESLKSVAEKSVSPVAAATEPDVPFQPSVVSPLKNHALYLWIHLSPQANAKMVAKVAAHLQDMVDSVVDPEMRDEEDEIWAGVGFGPNFCTKVLGNPAKNFKYCPRKGALGEMPCSGGDLFIHAKSNTPSKLFELCQLILQTFPKNSIHRYEDIYSFVYKNGRDLSGFIDGTENPADEEDRINVAVEKNTGGSYLITQKWIHDLNIIHNESTKTLEGWVGRQREDSVELKKKTITSHVARMVGGNEFARPKPVQIVRQSMPFGTVSGQAGLFFIGYAADPQNFDYMLDRMTGADSDNHNDDIMRFSVNTKGSYWYFPGNADLKKLAS